MIVPIYISLDLLYYAHAMESLGVFSHYVSGCIYSQMTFRDKKKRCFIQCEQTTVQ